MGSNLSYLELLEIESFQDRLSYLQLKSRPGDQTFGPLRHINQKFYNSPLWKQIRQQVIGRDLGYDLAVPGMDIFGKVIIHHINPLRPKDIYLGRANVVDLNNLITVSHDTHQAIHYGSEILEPTVVDRRPGDTQLWRPL